MYVWNIRWYGSDDEPKESWVARWQRISSHCPGLYAIRITGSLPEHVLVDLEHKGLGAIARQRDDD
ncbi:hypothetical protein H4Q26_015492 [Puccinia striiformis f. sp. tritici PST-130]|nr:hypothetical protein H4Q26_015492 [Puccinia striiformis f. sp. tritici PST-130]